MSQTGLPLVRRLGALTETIHAVVYFAPEPADAFAALGLRGYWRGYFASRLAACGPVGPELATALLGGFAPAMVARAVPSVWAIAEPAEVVLTRTTAATAALHRLCSLTDLSSVAEAADLLGRCVAGLSVSGRPMAAAQTAVPRPADPLGALWRDSTVLREHRGDGHLAAVAAAGLRWPEPHLLAEVDLHQQEYRGWDDDSWAAASDHVTELDPATHEEIEIETDGLAAAAYAVLSEAEGWRLVDLLTPLAAAAARELPFPNAMGLRPMTPTAPEGL